MTRTEMIENIKGLAAAFGIALVMLLVATLLIGGVFTMEAAGQDATQAWTGLGMIVAALAGAFVVARIIPTR